MTSDWFSFSSKCRHLGYTEVCRLYRHKRFCAFANIAVDDEEKDFDKSIEFEIRIDKADDDDDSMRMARCPASPALIHILHGRFDTAVYYDAAECEH